MPRRGRLLAWLVLPLLAGCAGLAERAGQQFARDLGRAVLDHDDPATVRDGLPAYLLLLDARIAGDPGSGATLQAAAGLYAAYAGSFVADAERARRLSSRALDYAWRAQCALATPLCDGRGLRFDALQARIAQVPEAQLAALDVLARAWATWIQANSGDWNAVADIPRVQLLLERVVALAPGHEEGMPLAYLGVLHSLRPPALGGEPERGRAYFERALAMSGGRNLMAATLFAEFHARLVFDRALHDRLLGEVLAADPRAPGLTLSNTLAQERARALLAGADDFF